MVEPTESESKKQLDYFAETLLKVIREAYSNSEKVKSSPHNTSVGRVDEVKASHPRTITPTWRIYKMRREERRGNTPSKVS